tara:strand:- start:3968 stop:4354 length:387 start_codon:yes stop_codon:yes gene_type:complete
MAYYNGSGGLVKSGSSTVGQITSFDITQDTETVDVTSLGDASKGFATTIKSWGGSITVKGDTDDAGQATLINGSTIAITAQFEGGASGRQQLTGNVIINNISSSLEAQGVVETSFSFVGNGDLTIADI